MNQNTQAKEFEVDVLGVSWDKNVFKAQDEYGNESWIKVIEPADIKYVKKGGKAKVRMVTDENNEMVANYVRMTDMPQKQGFTPKSNYNKPSYSNGLKQSYQNNSFKPANNVRPEPEYHFENQVKVLEGVTLLEYEKTYNELAKVNWVTASQIFPTPIIAKKLKDTDPTHILYDTIIYLKVKIEGNRNNSDEPQESGDVF